MAQLIPKLNVFPFKLIPKLLFWLALELGLGAGARAGGRSAAWPCCAERRGQPMAAHLVRERVHRLFPTGIQAPGGRRSNRLVYQVVHQPSRLQAVSSAVNHLSGRSFLALRRGGH